MFEAPPRSVLFDEFGQQVLHFGRLDGLSGNRAHGFPLPHSIVSSP